MEPDDLTEVAKRYAEPDEVEALQAATLARLAWRLRRGYKVCSRCRFKKPVTGFRKDVTRRDGLYVTCRTCEACKRTP